MPQEPPSIPGSTHRVVIKEPATHMPPLGASFIGTTVSIEVVQLPINEKADVGANERSGGTALHHAAGGGYLTIIESLVKRGVDVEAKDGLGNAGLHYAGRTGSLGFAQSLITRGPNIKKKSEIPTQPDVWHTPDPATGNVGEPALHFAALGVQLGILGWLHEEENATERKSGGLDPTKLDRKSPSLKPSTNPKSTASVAGWANLFRTRDKRKADDADLKVCIPLHSEPLSCPPAPRPNRSSSPNNLATALLALFEQRGDIEALEESISLHREPLSLTPAPHPDRSSSLNNLANALSTLFKHHGGMEVLEECILLNRELLSLRPTPIPIISCY
ncbi:hypothetical protein D9756_007292 [Leucocoprinus leucothites]|uniref:Uncharacterized protein n=1 Tax=Leucocoprinus leucothites TaxID=201217 RepID=A0A8H5FY93_9AGAR|nr:hypothetical protein D9756_007292 [Leucoagaricus leucothites]